MRGLILLTTVIFLNTFNLYSQDGQNEYGSFSDFYNLESESLLDGPPLSGSLKLGINSEGDLYMLDLAQSSVMVYNDSLKLTNQFGRKGKGPGEFDKPTDLYIDEYDNVLVLDASLFRVSKFDRSGELMETFSLRNRATDMVTFDDLLCLHSGGAIPIDGNTVDCFSYSDGSWQKSLIEKSKVIGDRPIGFSNATFHLIQKTEENVVVLQHPLDGTIHVFNNEIELINKFEIKNTVFEQPDFPKEFNPTSNSLKDFVSSTISGLFAFEEKILIVFIEYGTGTKYMDIYNSQGKRLIDEVILLDRTWPVYADKDGNLYSVSYAENRQDLNLKKFKPINWE